VTVVIEIHIYSGVVVVYNTDGWTHCLIRGGIVILSIMILMLLLFICKNFIIMISFYRVKRILILPASVLH